MNTTRRSFLSLLAASSAALFLGGSGVKAGKKPEDRASVTYVAGQDVGVKSVLLDGREVSKFCTRANPIEGWVECYKRKTTTLGDCQIDPSGEREILHGKVEVSFQ